MKVFVVGKAYDYMYFIQEKIIRVQDLKDADLVLFTGGEDVWPGAYGHPIHETTGFNRQRDVAEAYEFEAALAQNKLMVGICRGSQFLTVMSGGRLFQDVDRHAIAGTHEIELSAPPPLEILNGLYHITSTHHQMMFPWTAEQYEILAVASPPRCSYREFLGPDEESVLMTPQEPEIVWYPHTRALCIQGHPEHMHHSMPIITVINKLIRHYL